MTPFQLAWSNLAHKRTRTSIAVAGVAFAVALIFMELGMFGGVGNTATMLYESLRFDLLILSSEYLDVSRPADFSRTRIGQARATEGVVDAIPLSLGVGSWKMPARRGFFGQYRPPTGLARSINLLGAPPGRFADTFDVDRGKVFPSRAEAEAGGRAVSRLDTFLFDRKSKPEFGRVADLMAVPPAGDPVPDDPTNRNSLRLNGKRCEIVGSFELGTGFSWNALVLGSEETFARFTHQPDDRVTFGLVTVAPGADREVVRQSILSRLPNDVRVMTREEVNTQERRYWLRLTSVGQFLVVAVVLAVVVGVIFVYQMMAADIRAMLPEYATVKALGYGPGYLTGVVLWQATFLAGLGYLPGFASAFGLYYISRNYGGIPTLMTAERAVLVLVMTCGMCLLSGVLALRKVHTADPADLF